MAKYKLIWGIIFLCALFIFVAFVTVSEIVYAPKKPYLGPSTETIKTKGILEPGGYVDISFSPGLRSLKGYYKGEVEIYALYPDEIDVNNTMWDNDEYTEIGKSWGSSMSGGPDSMESLTVEHTINIPDDDELAGKSVAIYLKYSIEYPVIEGGAPGIDTYYFTDERDKFEEYVVIELGNTALSDDEIKELEEENNKIEAIMTQLGKVAGISLFVGILALIMLPMPSLSAKLKSKIAN